MSAATPRPAARPAARPVFGWLELEVTGAEDAEGDREEEGETDETDETSTVALSRDSVDVETRIPELVATKPGQDVLPITVTVVGCEAPNLIALTPVSQLQSGSLGQQYQFTSPDSGHFASGIDVLESDE